MQLRIMSFNTQHCLNYITRQVDFDRMAEAILECKADIVGLNEMYNLGSPTHPECAVNIKRKCEVVRLFIPRLWYAIAPINDTPHRMVYEKVIYQYDEECLRLSLVL